jgi:hypothetical protein
MKHILLTTLLASIIPILGCSLFAGEPEGDIDYPYYAPQERRDTIENGCGELRIGMYADEVKGILGEPDEIDDVLHPSDILNKNAEPIGYSYVYLIQRLCDKGSVDEKDEKLLRLHFDLEDKLIRVFRVGF